MDSPWPCLSPRELALWRAANERLDTRHDRSATLCADCTIAYAAEQRAEGKCNGTPGVPETLPGRTVAA
jgi:hypothetical protein